MNYDTLHAFLDTLGTGLVALGGLNLLLILVWDWYEQD